MPSHSASSTRDQRPSSALSQPRKRQRRKLSCLPCRVYKLRCDRAVPCQSCVRYGREDRCRLNPTPAAVMAQANTQQNSTVLPRGRTETPPGLMMNCALPLTPSSAAAAESVKVSEPSSASFEDMGPSYSRQTPRYPALEQDPYAGSTGAALTGFHRPSRKDACLEGITVASALFSRPYNAADRTLLDEPASYWKRYLISILPSQTQCDMLATYYFENINWIYQAIHAPSFRIEYTKFWATDIPDIDLIWLSLLYMILCLAGIFVPSQMVETVGFEPSDLPTLCQRWYSACRQALHAGGYDSKPTLTQIQVFLISQLYWYNTKNVEVLNSHMGQTIRNAQALGLDKEAPASITDCIEREMRHRIWWDLVSSDTFQSICLGRPPLLQSHLSTVPFPSNCNDVDITPSAILVHPLSEPTEMSMHYFRARVFKTLNKLFANNGSNLSCYSFVAGIDGEVMDILDEYPWYLREDFESLQRRLSPSLVLVITWMRHILHSCVFTQRVRMYRPFLNPLVGDSWQICVSASSSILAVYKSLRGPNVERFQRSQKMHVQAYQVFSAAVALATFLLVEMPPSAESIRSDIELVLDDLDSHSRSVEEARWVPLIADGRKVIRRILALYDARCKHALKGSVPQDGRSSCGASQQDEPPTALVPAISSVLGGESSAHRYLERISIDHRVNDPSAPHGSASAHNISTALVEMSAWDAMIDPAQWGPWGDSLWADLDSVLPIDTEAP